MVAGHSRQIASEEKPREHRDYPTPSDWEKLRSKMNLPAYDELVYHFDLPPGLTDVWSDINFYDRTEVKFHPTQKPIPLMARLVKAYSREGHTVMDLFAGSGTTAVACKMHGRKFIGCERDKTYYDKSMARINNAAKEDVYPMSRCELRVASG